MTKKGLAATVLVMALLSAASPAGALVSETSGLACQSHARRTLRSQNLETVDARTFHIEAKAAGKRFKVGAVVPMTVTVTRPAEQDPFNLGIPLDSPVSQPLPT